MYLDHLVLADEAVLVDVVEGEGPEQLVVVRALRDDREELHEVPEGDAASLFPGIQIGIYSRHR